MSQCTAPATGEHKSDRAFSTCPRCGPMLRQMDRITKKHERLTSPPAPSQWPPQQDKARRGHDFYPPDSSDIPDLGDTEDTPSAEKQIVAHYFVGNSDWWIVEAERSTGMAYGFARLNGDDEMSEWGYVSLPELESVRVGPFNVVERDLHWTETPVGDASLPDNASR